MPLMQSAHGAVPDVRVARPKPQVTMNEFTPTQRKILQVLSDGLPHPFSELLACLPDDLSEISALRMMLSRIRTKLRPRGEDIICQHLYHSHQYRHVRLLHSAGDGTR